MPRLNYTAVALVCAEMRFKTSDCTDPLATCGKFCWRTGRQNRHSDSSHCEVYTSQSIWPFPASIAQGTLGRSDITVRALIGHQMAVPIGVHPRHWWWITVSLTFWVPIQTHHPVTLNTHTQSHTAVRLWKPNLILSLRGESRTHLNHEVTFS